MRQDLLDLDPFSAAPSVPPDVRQFAELTGVDHATATRYLDAVKAHGADCVVVGSLIFFLKWLRSLGVPLVHTRFSPYAAKPGETNLQAHANDVVHFLSIARSYEPSSSSESARRSRSAASRLVVLGRPYALSVVSCSALR